MVKKIAFNPFLYIVTNWSVFYGNLEVNNFIIWNHINLKFGHIVHSHIKSWYKKDLCESAFNTKVMSSRAFEFVLKSLFSKNSKIWKLRGGSQIGSKAIGL